MRRAHSKASWRPLLICPLQENTSVGREFQDNASREIHPLAGLAVSRTGCFWRRGWFEPRTARKSSMLEHVPCGLGAMLHNPGLPGATHMSPSALPFLFAIAYAHVSLLSNWLTHNDTHPPTPPPAPPSPCQAPPTP